VCQTLGERPPLDAPLVVPLEVMYVGIASAVGGLVECDICAGYIVLVTLGGLGDVAEGVVLGEKSPAVDNVAAKK